MIKTPDDEDTQTIYINTAIGKNNDESNHFNDNCNFACYLFNAVSFTLPKLLSTIF